MKHIVLPALVGYAMLGFAALPTAAQAQDETEGRDALEEVTVTGSRLRRSGTQTPIPVSVLSKEDLEFSGFTDLGDFVNELPQLGIGVNRTTNTKGGSALGANLLNLRGLGSNRTLVVVNGRRHVGSIGGSTAVDVNSIPSALVERVEVSTGGASVAYGADAVSGVVNFVLKEDFEGVVFDSQYGTSTYGDADRKYAGVTAGTNFADDRGNAVVYVGYNETGGAEGRERDFLRRQWFLGTNPANTGPNDGIPALILYENGRIAAFNETGILTGALTGQRLAFTPDGQITTYDPGIARGPAAVGGDGVNVNDYQRVANPVKRYLVDSRLSYDLSDRTEVFFEAKFARAEANNTDQPTGDGQVFLDGAREFFDISPQNPFLPSDPRLDALFATHPPLSHLPGLAALDLSTVLFSKFHTDLGVRREEVERDTVRSVVGVRGDLPIRNWNYEAYYQFGQVKDDRIGHDTRDSSRFRLAVDAVTDVAGVVPGNNPGDPACRSTVAAYTNGTAGTDPEVDQCVPLNIFGFGNFSQAARDYVLTDITSQTKLQQQVANFSITGDLFEMPAGPVLFASGVEWRSEESNFRPGPVLQEGGVFSGGAQPLKGTYSVLETYFETQVPLISGQPFAELLSIEGGVRLSDYNTIGSTTAWRVSGEWAPVNDIRFRVGYAESVRAPNISELFSPQNVARTAVLDPCDPDNVNRGPNPARRAANCAELVPDGYTDPFKGVVKEVLLGGNPDLSEEASESLTMGMVFTPRWAPRLAVIVDYFDIKITGAVSTLNPTDLTNKCVDNFDNVGNEFCNLVTRSALGAILLVKAPVINVASIDTSGFDFEVDYGIDLADLGFSRARGALNFRILGTYLDELSIDPAGDAIQVDQQAGEMGTPHWKVNTSLSYISDSFTVNWQTRYIGGGELNVQDPNPEETADPHSVGSQMLHDVQLRYRLQPKTFRGEYDLFVGVDNVFNKEPPALSRMTSAPAGASALYDPVGRFFYGGVKIRF